MATIIASGGRNPVMVELDRLQAEARRKEKKAPRKGDAVMPQPTLAEEAAMHRRALEKTKAMLRKAATRKKAPAKKRSRK